MRCLEPGERNPQLRREIIVEAATTVIAAGGFNRMSLTLLARQIHMPVRSVQARFPFKHDILLEICERHMDAVVLAVEQADLPDVRTRRRLDALGTAMLSTITARAPAQLVLGIGMTDLAPRALRDLRRKQSWLAALFEDALEATVPQLARRRSLVAPAAQSLMVLLQGRAGWACDLRRPPGTTTYARFAVTSILEGVRCELRIRSGSR